jgi:hypothetical protein
MSRGLGEGDDDRGRQIAPLLGPAHARGPTERDFASLAMTKGGSEGGNSNV